MMTMLATHGRNPGDAFKRQEANWRRAYAETGSLRERFPGIEQLVAEIAFIDSKSMGTYSAQMHWYAGAAKAFFAFPCPRTLCLDGGFTLDTVVENMIAAGQDEATGSVECAGWIDPSRSQHAHCQLRLSYRINIRYEELERVSRRRARG